MKHLLLAFGIMAASPAAAGEHVCQSIGLLARNIMTARQVGVPLSELMSIATDDEGVNDLAHAMAIAAYDAPNYSMEENRAEQLREFVNAAEVACYKRID